MKNGQLQPGDTISAIRYEAWQPPLYYLLAAQLVRVGPPADPAAQVALLRRLNVLLGALTLPLAYLVGRALFPASQWLALAVPLAMVGVPMFSSVSSAVSADPLANLLAAGLVLLLIRGLQARSWTNNSGWAVATGVVLGLGILTKLALVVFVPLALGVALVRRRRPGRELASLLVVPAVLSLPWVTHQVTTYGWQDPFATARHAAVVGDQPRFPGLSPEYVVAFLTTSFHSFWAQFGWMAIPAPDRLYWAWGAIVVCGAAGLVVDAGRAECLPGRAWWLMGAMVALTVLAYVGYNLAYLQLQGRYLFIALVPICALLVRGWAAWLPRRARPVGPLAVGAALVLLNVYALTRVLEPGFRA